MVLKRAFDGLLALGLLLGLAGAAQAQAPDAMPPALEQALGEAAQLTDSGKPEEALPRLDALLAAAELPGEKARVQAIRTFALARLERVAEARAAGEQALAGLEAPPPSLFRLMVFLRGASEDHAGTAELLIQLASGDGKLLAEVPEQWILAARRGLRDDEARLFDLDYALVLAGWSPEDSIDSLDVVRLDAIAGLLRRDRREEAAELLAAVSKPEVLMSVAIDRRYEPLWPAAEAKLGAKGEKAAQGWLALAKAAFEAKPESLPRRADYIDALDDVGQREEGLKIGNVATTPEELAKLAESDIWMVSMHARLLGDTGRPDEGWARYAALNALDTRRQPFLLNSMINQALYGLSIDRLEDALAAAVIAEANATMASDFGKAYIVQAKACALSRLGRGDEAARIAAPLIDKPATNEAAYLTTMLCLGRDADAGAAAVRMLGADSSRGTLLQELQAFMIAPTKLRQDAWMRARMTALRKRPEVAAAFARAGRDLPVGLVNPNW